MGTGSLAGGYALNTIAKNQSTRSIQKVRKQKMKLTWKQRLRNWLNDTDDSDVPHQLTVSEDKLSSEGMRLHVYKASGGYVVETRKYDNKMDRHYTTLHVITENEDIGDRIGKIIMMEALRG